MLQGFTCYDCKTSLETPHDDATKAEIHAGKLGWVIGHRAGQAHYACPSCAPGLFEAETLDKLHQPVAAEDRHDSTPT